MNTALQKLAQYKPVLAAVQLAAVALALGVFYLFYVVLGNSLLIATPVAVIVAVALWQLLVVPLQRRAAHLEAEAQSLAETARKVTELGLLASKISNLTMRAQVLAIAEQFRYALDLQRSPAEPLARLTAQTLTDVALGSTLSLVTGYLKLAAKNRPTAEEQATRRKSEAFIGQLAVSIEAQGQRLQALAAGGADDSTGLETNMQTLQMLFDVGPTEALQTGPADVRQQGENR